MAGAGNVDWNCVDKFRAWSGLHSPAAHVVFPVRSARRLDHHRLRSRRSGTLEIDDFGGVLALFIVADDLNKFADLVPALFEFNTESSLWFVFGAEVELGHELGGEGNAVRAPLVHWSASFVKAFRVTALTAGFRMIVVDGNGRVDLRSNPLHHVGIINARHDGCSVVMKVVMTVMNFRFSGGGESVMAREVNTRQLDGVVWRGKCEDIGRAS